ncbi:MAG: hypothetical protein CMG74_06910 [Candidatus Marinimicrobia bacterium]|nr:hypothetical protein [Candidatus Neomarinimicrobiota bacterium]|tara:strand:- start:274 stop:642 length:369 start_codon:yes stop_codon:yes gene_type:complete
MKYLNISDKIKLDNITYNYDIKKEKYFLDILSEYIDIYNYIYFLQDIEIYKYKNILNYINHKWIKSENILFKKYKKNKYKKKYIKTEYDINFNKFNTILTDFIDNNIVIGIFVFNLIQSYIF